MAKTPSLRRGQRLPENQRGKIGAELLKRYEQGRSVREICAETGYSIGRVRRLLQDAGVTFRARGGARSRPRVAEPTASSSSANGRSGRASGRDVAGRAAGATGSLGTDETRG
ncbi:MAG TPA: helix-turn-helix domain-containing protein [Pseudonocardia sp.]